jgi:hypothetical protein
MLKDLKIQFYLIFIDNFDFKNFLDPLTTAYKKLLNVFYIPEPTYNLQGAGLSMNLD